MIVLIRSSDLIKYKFNQNFGEVFYDYSGNYLFSVNGKNSLDTLRNTIGTDRGAYFSVGNSIITLPPNDVSASFEYPTVFSVVFWVLVEDYTFYCFYCTSSTGLLYIQRYSIGSKLAVYISTDSFVVNEQLSPINSFSHQNWNLIILSVKNSLKLTINKTVYIDQLLTSAFSLGTIKSCQIGRKNTQTSMVGYLWSFSIATTEQSYSPYLGDSTSNCLIPGCSTCEFSIINDNIAGCVPEVLSPSQNSIQQQCSNCLGGCNTLTCLTCYYCGLNSCEFVSDQILCACPENSTATDSTCICPDGQYFNNTHCLNCLEDCSKCSQSTSCDECIALNANPTTGGCKCKSGYYNSTALYSLNSCILCESGCQECDSTGQCTLCKIHNALPSLNCKCEIGYYTDGDLCKACYAECGSCNTFGTCLSCLAEFAEIDTFGCKCIVGYGGKGVLNFDDACVKCHDDCETCSRINVCDTCKIENSQPGNLGCECKNGYFLANETCLACPKDCKKCDFIQCFECWDDLAEVNGTECFCPVGTFIKNFNDLECSACREDCKSCSDSTTCDECLILGAVKRNIGCSCEKGYYSDSVKCIKCSTWSEKFNSCLFCAQGTFFYNGECLACPALCTACQLDECLECVKNAELVSKACVCSTNFEGIEKCDLKDFKVSVNVDETNNLLILFSLEPRININETNLKILISGFDFTYTITKFNPKSYKVKINFSKEVIGNYKIECLLSNEITSFMNTSLTQTNFIVEVEGISVSSSKQYLNNTYTATSKSSLYVAMSLTFFLSLFNMNFISFWSFLNTVQLIIYIRLINTYLPKNFDIVLKTLRDSINIFNAFEYFIDEKGFANLDQKFYDFGFKSSILFLNVGDIITLFLILIGNNIFVIILKKMTVFKYFSCNFVKKIIDKLDSNYKYNTYIRFVIQAYLDFGVAGLLALIKFETDSVIGIFNCIFCIVIVILVVFTPVKTAIFINQHKDEIKGNDQELMQKYGSFFYEVSNDKGLFASYFYIFFFIKRLIFIIILFTLQSYPLMQLMLSCILNTSYTIYLFYFKPYSEILICYGNIFSESIISLIFLFLAVNEIIDDKSNADKTGEALIGLLFCIFIIQTSTPLVLILMKISKKVCICLRGLNKIDHNPQEITSIQQMSDIKNSGNFQIDDSLDNIKISAVKIAWKDVNS